MIGRMIDTWARRRRRSTPIRQAMPNGAARIREPDDVRPLGLVPLYEPPAHMAAALSTPDALRARAEVRFAIAQQDAAAGHLETAQRNRAEGESLLRQAMGR